MSEPKGTKAAVDQLMQDAQLPATGEQLGLLDPVAPAGEVPRVVLDGARRGRPAGSRNRRTQEIVDYLTAKYPLPLEGLLRLAAMSIDEIRAELGCSALEAGQERRHALVAVLPYIHQRQPIAVDVTNHKMVHLTIVEGGDELGASGDDDVVTVQAQIVSVQDVSDKEGSDV
jgi:hypothetical protein